MGKTILDFEKPVFELEQKLEEMKQSSGRLGIEKEIARIEAKVGQLKEERYKDLSRWQRVQLARHPDRPYTPHSFSATGRRGKSTAKTQETVEWDRFRPELGAVRDRERKSNAGRKTL